MWYRRTSLLLAASLCLAAACLAQGPNQSLSNEPNLTEEQKKEFLLHAKVVSSKQLGKGITHPWRLTLTDGGLTHDAAFQPVDEHKPIMQFADGKTEFNFIDSYRYDIAGYELARLVGMSDMIPVTVERSWNGQKGALAWWIPWKWDAAMLQQQKLHAPDADAWNKQMYKVRVFDQLIYDTDPNLTNVLITEDWKIWRIDFTRAFRLQHDLRDPNDVVMCDRQLLEKLRQLNGDDVLEKTKPQLTKSEVKAVMARRDKIVALVQQLIAQKGEGAVLY
ncbi:MAG TPA: hypothetical protein VKM93_06920 [Terriglobia bacterium]|nr:hypothetical protein [Terriglobia bacterium]